MFKDFVQSHDDFFGESQEKIDIFDAIADKNDHPPKNPIPPQFLKIQKKAIQKKKKKREVPKQGDFEFVQIYPPKKCVIPKTHKRFSIRFTYTLKDSKKVKSKTINFGNVNQTDFIDDLNDERRQKLMSRIRNYHTPFKANYWRVYLLNTTPKIGVSYLKMLKFQKLL